MRAGFVFKDTGGDQRGGKLIMEKEDRKEVSQEEADAEDTGQVPAAEGDEEGYSEEEKKEIEERLRSLGYIG